MDSKNQSRHTVRASRTCQSSHAAGGITGEKREIVPKLFPTLQQYPRKRVRQVLLKPEQFVSADEAAQFLCVKRAIAGAPRRGCGAYWLGQEAQTPKSGCFGSQNRRYP